MTILGRFPPFAPPKWGKNTKFQDFSTFFNSGGQTVNIRIFYLLILSQNNMSNPLQNKIGQFR